MRRRTFLRGSAASVVGRVARAGEPTSTSVGKPTLGPVLALPPTVRGFNSSALVPRAKHDLTYDSPTIAEPLAGLRPAALRFPGGTTANSYDWRIDSFDAQPDDRTGWAAKQLDWFRSTGRRLGLDAFANFCNRHDVTPVYVMNVHRETPESIPEWWRRVRKVGLDLRHVELGNETYWDPRSLMNVWSYIRSARPIAEAIRQVAPGVRIGVTFGPVDENPVDGGPYETRWNAKLAEDRSWWDAVVYHAYHGGQGIAPEPGRTPPRNPTRPESFVAGPVRRLRRAAPDRPIWWTEWNLGGDAIDSLRGTADEMLFVASAFVELVRHADVIPLACFHDAFNGKFGTFGFDDHGRPIKRPTWHLWSMIGEALQDVSKVRMIEPKPDGVVTGFRGETTAGQTRWVLVNRGTETRPIQMEDPVAKVRRMGVVERDQIREEIEVTPTRSLPLPIAGRSVTVVSGRG